MYDAVFQHRRKVRNVGDLACSPGSYFDFGTQTMLDFSEIAPPCRLAILGGGQVFGDCTAALIYRTQAARRKVIWGVGISNRDVKSLAFDIAEPGCDLISTRNRGVGRCDFVPCPSAMSPLFDQIPGPVHEVVLFSHHAKSGPLSRVPGIPEMNNHDITMKTAIGFLASGATVVTNSYHGTYWAMCLGRRVLCVPFSDKFRHFQDNPVFAGPRDWVEHLDKAEARPGTLETARRLNQAFYEKVRNLT